MSVHFHVHVLGSGSGGNTSVLSFSDSAGSPRHVLIDMGLGPRTTRTRALAKAIDLDLVDAIFLTHGDQDHCNPNWRRTLARRPIPVYVAPAHIPEALAAGIPAASIRRLVGTVEHEGALRISTAISPHRTPSSAASRFR